MNERRRSYDHTSSVTGARGADRDPATEHQDTASGNAEERNEIDARPGERDGDGPRTHEDTRIDRKGE